MFDLKHLVAVGALASALALPNQSWAQTAELMEPPGSLPHTLISVDQLDEVSREAVGEDFPFFSVGPEISAVPTWRFVSNGSNGAAGPSTWCAPFLEAKGLEEIISHADCLVTVTRLTMSVLEIEPPANGNFDHFWRTRPQNFVFVVPSFRSTRAEILARMDAAGNERLVEDEEAFADLIRGRLAEIEARLDAVEDAVDENRGRLDGVETGLADLSTSLDRRFDLERSIIEQRLEAVESREDVAALQRELADLTNAVANLETYDDSDLRGWIIDIEAQLADLDGVLERLAAVETELDSVATDAELALLQGQFEELRRSVIEAGNGYDDSALTGRVDALNLRIDQMAGMLADLARLENRLDDVATADDLEALREELLAVRPPGQGGESYDDSAIIARFAALENDLVDLETRVTEAAVEAATQAAEAAVDGKVDVYWWGESLVTWIIAALGLIGFAGLGLWIRTKANQSDLEAVASRVEVLELQRGIDGKFVLPSDFQDRLDRLKDEEALPIKVTLKDGSEKEIQLTKREGKKGDWIDMVGVDKTSSHNRVDSIKDTVVAKALAKAVDNGWVL